MNKKIDFNELVSDYFYNMIDEVDGMKCLVLDIETTSKYFSYVK